MTNEQCIEIAEKVWGWPTIQGYWVNPETEKPVFNDGLREEVNSWQGFGRTVEAMAEKGWAFSELCGPTEEDLNNGDRLSFHKFSDDIFYPLEWDNCVPKSLIEATHLAALEALK